MINTTKTVDSTIQQINVVQNLPPIPNDKVGGRLKHFWKKFEGIGASHYTINLLKYGLTLQFVQKPPLVNNPIILDSYENNKEKIKALRTVLE